ncbi:tetratricopeptide repeat protein, partial [Streptomyces sp. NPDC041003]|uniref:tetratricopeptide repeat protein n=1 Tax=Streptomyces sp. NPDC041003 TaxID=3155730 RepID=UPI0033F854AF
MGRLTEARHGSLRPPHSGRVRGREVELQKLERLLKRKQGRFTVLCGAGGVGKTTVAAELAAIAERAGYRVFWIRWRTTAQLAQLMTQVAVACGLSDEELRAARAGQASLPDVIWRHLEGSRRWLLVIDNADEPEAIGPEGETVASYRGWIRPQGGGLLLITTRDTSASSWGACADLLRLAPLQAVPAGQILLDAAPGAGTADQAQELADRLGGLPLALRAAGAYLATPTSRYRTFASYKQALQAELPDLLGAAHPNADNPDTARRVVRHTWELSLDQLARDGVPLAHTLLRLLARLALAPVPLPLISPGLLAEVAGEQVSAIALEAAFAGLHRYGLLDTPLTDNTPGRESDSDIAQVMLHPLVREITALAQFADRADLTPWHQALAERLTTAVEEVAHAGRSGWPTAILLAPHLALLLECPTTRTFAEVRVTLTTLANVLDDAGAYTAELLLRQCLLHAETHRLGPDHPETLTSRNDLAHVLQDLGEYGEAERLHRQNLDDRSRVLGPDHPDTLTSRHNLTNASQRPRAYGEAERLHRQNLDDRTRVLGPDHPDTLTSRHSLAFALHANGVYGEAERLHRQNLDDRTRILGPDHPDTLSSRSGLAVALGGLDEYGEAERLHRQNLDDRSRILGPDHPHALTSRHGLACALQDLGEYGEAERLHRQNLDDR